MLRTGSLLAVALIVLLWAGPAACSSPTGGDGLPPQAPAPTSPAPKPTWTPGTGPAAGQGQQPPAPVAQPKRSVPAPPVTATGNGPRIAFAVEEIDYGDVQFGDVVQASFEFKNVGNEPLIISNSQVETVEGC